MTSSHTHITHISNSKERNTFGVGFTSLCWYYLHPPFLNSSIYTYIHTYIHLYPSCIHTQVPTFTCMRSHVLYSTFNQVEANGPRWSSPGRWCKPQVHTQTATSIVQVIIRVFFSLQKPLFNALFSTFARKSRTLIMTQTIFHFFILKNTVGNIL